MEGVAFSNQQVGMNKLPEIEHQLFEPLSPAYRKLNLMVTTVIFSVLALLVSAIRFQPFVELPEPLKFAYPIVLGGILGIGTLSFMYHWFADKRILYALREQDLSLQKGLFFRSLACQPVLRIQHIELKRGPLDRLVGLAKLQVFSAGGAGHTFEIPGLAVSQAQKIRQFILAHKDVGAR
ncbi:PH domain-containing protein [Aestuariibacter sp. A3R04]|uniref:PH domain-containing protein n=1 Tax=Aestuariibacter sp. A3R04 TaxID=2841571 RepID=UPI001C091752|nr:PH domain-containing protein [Aestuariibacter sp. A3R04]MBU3021446.1 PH domain-containing protein [Aestuariibacter sp. A3R04]